METADERKLEKLYSDFSSDLSKIKQDVEQIKGELGIRWPNDQGLKSRVETLERGNIKDQYSITTVMRLLYGAFFFQLINTIFLTYLALAVARLAGAF